MLAQTNQARALSINEAREARAAAEHADPTKSDVLAITSQEWRTPHNSVTRFAALMLRGIGVLRPPITGDPRYLLTRIKDNSIRLLQLINDILDMSRIEAGKVQVVPCSLSIREMLAKLVLE